MRKAVLILFVFILVNGIFGQAPITFSINIASLPTCSTCCDGGLCVTPPSGGCNGSYTYSWGPGYTGPTGCSPGIYCNNMTYTVCVFDFCDTACKVFTFPPYTGIEELSGNSPFFIYPNPANEMLSIGSKTSKDIFIEATFIDILGNKIPAPYKQEKINTSFLAPGRYTLQLKSEAGAYYHYKFLKE